MTTEENYLWSKIVSFNLDDNASSFKFSERLARENGWTIGYSTKVIEEYKKFIFLCCVTKTGVTPSDQVDQVWHLHLTYTKSYWVELCKNVLQKDIHHNPTKGGEKEGAKFDDFYTDTINLYKEKFKSEPPSTIWPNNKVRFSDINFQRVNLNHYLLLRKPYFNKKRFFVLLLVLSSFLFINAADDSVQTIFTIVIIVGIVVYGIFKGGGGNSKNNGSGCSTSGCGGSGDSGHSGCSGCSSSGCSGCGGGD